MAITDHGTLAAAWDALKASKETGVKLIMGCECYFLDDASQTDERFRHVILLAKNATGYRNLLTINKKGFDQGHFLGKKVYPIVDWKLLEQNSAQTIRNTFQKLLPGVQTTAWDGRLPEKYKKV